MCEEARCCVVARIQSPAPMKSSSGSLLNIFWQSETLAKHIRKLFAARSDWKAQQTGGSIRGILCVVFRLAE